MTELKPCPFCGGPAGFEECPQGSSVHASSCTWSVGCQNVDEDCIGYQMMAHYNRKSEAAEAWNKRSSIPAQQPASPDSADSPEPVYTYLLCACGLETRVRCAEIGCPDAKESNRPAPRGCR